MPGEVKPGDEWIPLAVLGRCGPGDDRGVGLVVQTYFFLTREAEARGS